MNRAMCRRRHATRVISCVVVVTRLCDHVVGYGGAQLGDSHVVCCAFDEVQCSYVCSESALAECFRM